MIGVIVSLMEIGAFIGSVSSAFFGEKIGRKKSITVGVVILILGSLVQATAYNRGHLIVGRVVSGIGLGIVNSTVPVMQAEFAPKATRGLCMAPPVAKLLYDAKELQMSACNCPPSILGFCWLTGLITRSQHTQAATPGEFL
jgi:hypothetical protein